MMSYRKHRWTAVATLLVAIGLAAASFMPNISGYEFPQMIALVAVVIATIMVLLAWVPKRPATLADEEPIPWGTIWPLMLILAGFLLVMEWLGFFVTSYVAFFLIILIYSPQRINLRGVIKGAVITGLFLGVLYLIFVTLLRVQIPQGVLA